MRHRLQIIFISFFTLLLTHGLRADDAIKSTTLYTHPTYKFGFEIPTAWSDFKGEGDTIRYSYGDYHFLIDIKKFDAPISLEKWMVDSSVDNTELKSMTLRQMQYKKGKIAGVRMVRFKGDITTGEGTDNERKYAVCSYTFVQDKIGFEVKVISLGETVPDSILDKIMRSFRIAQ